MLGETIKRRGPALARLASVALAVASTACGDSTTDPGVTGTPNEPPVPAFTTDVSVGPAPLEVTFDGGASVDPDGTIVSWAWSFGDGTTGSGRTTTHVYGEVGSFAPSLTVTDDRGAQRGLTGEPITVNSPPGQGTQQIMGAVWHDADADGNWDEAEGTIPDLVVFLDEDDDGLRDEGEVAAVTDDEGRYAFDGLDASRTYTVTQELTLGWTNTAPGSAPSGEPERAHSGPQRIIGGSDAEPGAFPFQVALVTAETDFQFCGGTFVAGGWVLTAAHCVVGTQPEAIRVLAGTHDLESGGQLIEVADVLVHPSYSSTAFVDHDIALLELEGSYAFSRVELLTPDRIGLSAPGVLATVVGWGLTTDSGEGSTVLKRLDAPLISNDECRTQLSDNILAVTICAGKAGSNESVCNGDSGGPLMVPYRERWMQVGIVSFGANICYQPTAFARISALVGFVTDHVPAERSGAVTVTWAPGETTATVSFGNFR